MHNIAFVVHILVVIIGVAAIYGLAKKGALPTGIMPGRDIPVWIFALGVIGLGAVELLIVKVSSPPDRLWDFLNAYYPAGQAALYHDSALLRSSIGKGVSGFVNVPLVAYLFAPFALFPPKLAAILFTLVGLGVMVATWVMLVRLARLELRERWLLAFLFLVNGPLINGIKLGNLSYPLLFALTGGLMLIRQGRSGAAGVLLGLATVIKPPLALFGFFFLFRRDLRGVAGFAAAGLGTVLMSLAVFGWADNLYWFQTCILQYSHKWLASFSVQSIPAFFFRLHSGPDILLNWLPHTPQAGEKFLAQALIGLILLAAIGVCFASSYRARVQDAAMDNKRRDLQYLLVICLCLVAGPLAWAHYYAWLLIPTAFFLRRNPPEGATAGLLWTAIALSTPLVMWPSVTTGLLATLYTSFAVSHLLFGGLVWFGIVAWSLFRSGKLLALRAQTSATEPT